VTQTEPVLATGYNVEAEIHRLTLQLLEFYRTSDGDIEPGVDVDAEIKWSLGLEWIAYQSIIGVELGVTLNAPAHFRLRAVFRAILEPKAPKEDDMYWRTLAARVGPVVLFPFVRETVAAATARSGFPAAIMPIISAGNLFDPATINMPPVPGHEKPIHDLPDSGTTV
jgi:preprotein translocase subunit SecB